MNKGKTSKQLTRRRKGNLSPRTGGTRRRAGPALTPAPGKAQEADTRHCERGMRCGTKSSRASPSISSPSRACVYNVSRLMPSHHLPPVTLFPLTTNSQLSYCNSLLTGITASYAVFNMLARKRPAIFLICSDLSSCVPPPQRESPSSQSDP